MGRPLPHARAVGGSAAMRDGNARFVFAADGLVGGPWAPLADKKKVDPFQDRSKNSVRRLESFPNQ